MAQVNFNPSTVEPSGNFRQPMPKGRYIVACEKSEVKPNKKGTGHVLALVFSVMEGDHKNRKIFEYINIQNENPTAQRIGQQQLAGFCHAVGISQLENSFQLHGIPVEVDVDIREAKDGWDAKNVIKGFVKKADVAGGLDLSASASSMQSVSNSPSMQSPPAYAPPIKGVRSAQDIDDDIPF